MCIRYATITEPMYCWHSNICSGNITIPTARWDLCIFGCQSVTYKIALKNCCNLFQVKHDLSGQHSSVTMSQCNISIVQLNSQLLFMLVKQGTHHSGNEIRKV